ncbi:AbrB/MazE/SpoVT family DNA-binding domain-containing protein [Candidatus Gottesmanbacteria bacterium]|nr:AbrB/MazE/SpoVT family DNA-binding domain-containing protein [Candidatus Gottesmanbacteria bacterium]
MNIGIITYPNQKGQIVIPKTMRNQLGISHKVALNIVMQEDKIYLQTVKDIVTTNQSKNELLIKMLSKTAGSWANDDWPKTEKRRRKIELKAATRRKRASW